MQGKLNPAKAAWSETALELIPGAQENGFKVPLPQQFVI